MVGRFGERRTRQMRIARLDPCRPFTEEHGGLRSSRAEVNSEWRDGWHPWVGLNNGVNRRRWKTKEIAAALGAE